MRKFIAVLSLSLVLSTPAFAEDKGHEGSTTSDHANTEMKHDETKKDGEMAKGEASATAESTEHPAATPTAESTPAQEHKESH